MKGNELEPTCFAKFSLQAMTNFSMTSSSLTFSNFGGNCSNVSEIILMCEHLEKILTISCEHLVELVVFALSYTCKMVKLCVRCVQDICKICPICVQDVRKMCARCVQGMRKAV